MATAKERQEFIVTFREQFPERSREECIQAARLLLRHARSHANVAEAQCNGPGDYVNRIPYPEAGRIYEKHQADCERREQQLERRIKEICDGFKLRVEFGGDPRGFTVNIFFPSGIYNSWGGKGSGYGVPS